MAGLVITWDDKITDPKKAGGSPTYLDHISRTGKLAFDNSYPTGGEPLSASMLQLAEVFFVDVPPNAGLVFQYDYTNSKLMVFQGDNNNAADGPLVEIANAVDLSARNAVHFEVIGRVASY